MPTKSTTSKTAKPKAPAKAAKRASKSKPSATPAAKPKSAAKLEGAAKPKAAAQPAHAAADLSPLDTVKPLIRVRQMRAFTGKRVTNAELEAITEVARWSGSSRNEQPCRFITLRDQATIRKVAELGLPQTRGLPTANVAIAIIVPDEPERELSRAFDDGRAAERILIAVNMLGLGGGISRVRPDVRSGINRVLGLPSNRSVRTIVAIGHPTEDAIAPKSTPGRARLPREEVIFDGSWPDPPSKG